MGAITGVEQPPSEGRLPLRFGIMCDGVSLQAFEREAVRRLIDTKTALPALLIVDDRPALEESPLARAVRRLTAPKLLWRLYRTATEPDASRRVPLDPDLTTLPRVLCRPRTKGRFSEYFSEEELAAVRSHDLDFILRFAFGIVRGEILRTARHGVWSFHHGDEQRYRGGPPAFWEIFHDEPLTGAILQRLTDRLDAGVVLRRGHVKTIDYSYKHNLNRVLKESTPWPVAVASAISAGAFEESAGESVTPAPVMVAPTNVEMLRYFVRLSKKIAQRLYERQLREDWNVGAVRLTPEDAVKGGVLRNVRWHPRIPDGWIADPMARPNGKGIHVLCERMRLASGLGHIAAVTFDGLTWGTEKSVIDIGCHASYPYVFSIDGQTYCVPETHEAGEVALYRAVDFPNGWVRVAKLLDGIRVVDGTIFQYHGRWWLLCTDMEGPDHRLVAFYADDVFGPWHPHVQNPVKVDARSARPAGPPFWHEGVFYRPSQDSSATYGGRIVINKILELSPSRFREDPAAYLEPDPREPFGKALHTLSFAGEWAIIDGKRWRWKGRLAV
jgi:hypothetical protein